MVKKLRYYGLVTLFYFLIAGLALYRVFLQPNMMPGSLIKGYYVTDFYHFHWNFWWIRHALTTPGLEVYETNFVMYPATSNLGFHTMAPFYFPIWALFEPLLGTINAFNITIIVGLALTGISFFALARHFNVHRGLALAGGVALQLTPGNWNAIYMSTLHYLSIFWLPVHILVWDRVTHQTTSHRRGFMWAALMGITFWGTLMTDPQTLVYTAILIVPFGLVRFVETENLSQKLAQGLYAVLAILTMLVLSWFVGPLRYMLLFDRNSLSPGGYEGAFDIDFPDGFVSRLPEYWLTMSGISLGAVVIPVFLMSIVVAIIYRQHLQRRRLIFWFTLAIIPLLLSAGGTIHIFGSDIAMPYRVVHSLFGGIFRQPARFANVFLVAGLLAAGMVWTELIKRQSAKTWLSLVLLLVVLYDTRIFESVPTQEAPVAYSFYKAFGNETGEPYDDYIVLEVPTSGASGETSLGPPQSLTTQFYALYHHKRTVNGLIARVDNAKFLYMETSDPVMSWLGQRRYLDPQLVESQLREMIYEWPIGYIVIHKDYVGGTNPANQEIIGYFNQLDDLLCPYAIEGDAVVYRTKWHPDGCPDRTPPEIAPDTYQIDIGSEGDDKFIGWGFHWQEQIFDLKMRWTGMQPLINGETGYSQVDLYVDLPPAAYEMQFEAQSFVEDRQVEVVVNGEWIETVTITPQNLATYSALIPADVIGSGDHIHIALRYDDAIVPLEAGINSDPRRLAFMMTWVKFSKA